MKKLFLVGALALFGAMNAQTGGFKLGAHLGLVSGDLKPAYGLNLGVDAAYTWNVAENFDLGLATGYSNYVPKSDFSDAGGKSMGLIPFAATGQYKFDGGFYLGADLGYGLLMYDGETDGGFYYQPKLGYTFSPNNSLYLSYKGVSQNGATASSVNLGYTYSFGK